MAYKPDAADRGQEEGTLEGSNSAPCVEGCEPSSTGLEARDPGIVRLVRSFLEGNYFYVLSAILMMLGCYWLMPGSIEEAAQFERRLTALALLQAYEVLVIATAIVLVARLKILGDAFTLFVVELILLFDPTCFSNAFFTLKTVPGGMVNVVCCVLVPLKLIVLQRYLRIHISHRAFVSLLFTAAFVYLGEGPLNLAHLPLSHFSYLSCLTWAVFVLMLLLPPLEHMGDLVAGKPEFATERQRWWLRRYLQGIPLVVVVAHLLETQQVFDIPFFPFFLAPIALAGTLLLVKTLPPKTDNEGILVFLDCIVFCALLFSMPGTNGSFNESIPQSFRTPGWVESGLPVAGWGLAALLIYGIAFARWRRITALYRIGMILMGGVFYMLFKAGVPATVQSFAGEHPLVMVFLLWLAATAIAIRFRSFWNWAFAGVIGIAFVTARMAMWEIWLIPEGLQGFFLILMVLYHSYGDPRNERYTSAVVVAGLALGRLIVDPGWWQGGVVGLEIIGFLTAGWLLRQPGYLVVGALQGCLFGAYIGKKFASLLSIGLVAVAGALMLFALGVAVSFQKQRLMRGLDYLAAPLKGPSQEDP